MCVHVSGGRILTIVEKVAHDKALVPVRLHLVSVPISHCDVEFTTVIVMNENAWCLRGSTSVFVLISPCAAEYTTVRVMNKNALVPVRLHISFRTDIAFRCWVHDCESKERECFGACAVPHQFSY